MIQTLIVSLTFFAAGTVLYLAMRNLRAAIHSTGSERRLNGAYAAARLGFVIVVGLITEAIFKAPSIPFSWRVALYLVGLVLVAVGYLGIAVEGRRRSK